MVHECKTHKCNIDFLLTKPSHINKLTIAIPIASIEHKQYKRLVARNLELFLLFKVGRKQTSCHMNRKSQAFAMMALLIELNVLVLQRLDLLRHRAPICSGDGPRALRQDMH
jgi:hypothetical protein